MSIEDRNLKPGTKLVARYKGKEYTAEVVQTEEGLRYRLEDGRYFCSACMEAFEALAGVEPQGCPQGHRPEDFETA
jgi:hypothetical protein